MMSFFCILFSSFQKEYIKRRARMKGGKVFRVKKSQLLSPFPCPVRFSKGSTRTDDVTGCLLVFVSEL